VKLEARGGEAAVQVEWRNKSVQVAPTDFFSDSQKQILMLSIFLAGGLRQNWTIVGEGQTPLPRTCFCVEFASPWISLKKNKQPVTCLKIRIK
jgi:hypothetical protein